MRKIIFILMLIFLSSIIYAQEDVNLVMFYGQGCPHCVSLHGYLEDLEETYPTLNVIEYEVYFDNDNRELFQDMVDSFGVEISGVPTIFVDDQVIVGFSRTIADTIDDAVGRCLEVDCGNPLERVEISDSVEIIGESSPSESPEKTEMKKRLTIPVVISAAIVDAINPCAFAVLIILVTTILASGIKRRALFAGLAFSGSIFISYFLMGLGLYSAIQAAGLSRGFFIFVSGLAILVGLFNLKDYLWYGKWFIMEVPISWRPKMKSLLKGVTSVPGAFFIGFIVSLFLLPCTSGPYIVILGLLAEVTTRNYAILLLLLYNMIFVSPMVLITLGVYFGLTTTEKAEKWRSRSLETLHLIAGVLLLLIGIGMLIALKIGLI